MDIELLLYINNLSLVHYGRCELAISLGNIELFFSLLGLSIRYLFKTT